MGKPVQGQGSVPGSLPWGPPAPEVACESPITTGTHGSQGHLVPTSPNSAALGDCHSGFLVDMYRVTFFFIQGDQRLISSSPQPRTENPIENTFKSPSLPVSLRSLAFSSWCLLTSLFHALWVSGCFFLPPPDFPPLTPCSLSLHLPPPFSRDLPLLSAISLLWPSYLEINRVLPRTSGLAPWPRPTRPSNGLVLGRRGVEPALALPLLSSGKPSRARQEGVNREPPPPRPPPALHLISGPAGARSWASGGKGGRREARGSGRVERLEMEGEGREGAEVGRIKGGPGVSRGFESRLASVSPLVPLPSGLTSPPLGMGNPSHPTPSGRPSSESAVKCQLSFTGPFEETEAHEDGATCQGTALGRPALNWAVLWGFVYMLENKTQHKTPVRRSCSPVTLGLSRCRPAQANDWERATVWDISGLRLRDGNLES